MQKLRKSKQKIGIYKIYILNCCEAKQRPDIFGYKFGQVLCKYHIFYGRN